MNTLYFFLVVVVVGGDTSAPPCIAQGHLKACATREGTGTSYILVLSREGNSILSSTGIVAEYTLQPWTGAATVSTTALKLTATHVGSTAQITALVELTGGGGFNATVTASFSPSPPTSLSNSSCLDRPYAVGVNRQHSDIAHFRQLNDSRDPALCRASCCNSSTCEVWTLMNTGTLSVT